MNSKSRDRYGSESATRMESEEGRQLQKGGENVQKGRLEEDKLLKQSLKRIEESVGQHKKIYSSVKDSLKLIDKYDERHQLIDGQQFYGKGNFNCENTC